MSLTTQQIAELIGGTLDGPGDVRVMSMERIDAARSDQITYVADEKYASRWSASRAGAVIAPTTLDLKTRNGQAVILVSNVELAVALVLEKLAPKPITPGPGVHESAVIDRSAKLGADVRIGPNCFVGPGAVIDDNVVMHANVCVHAESKIGEATTLWSGVVVRERCVIGSRCILHANVTIGADGFGYTPSTDGKGLVKIPQIGNVVIGDYVEIGANSCVDRAKFGSTTIGDGTKIDNLCQIAHNCRIGRCVVIAGSSGVAGSAVIEDSVMIGGGVEVRDHITIGTGARIMASSPVMNDVPAGATWAGYPAKDSKMTFRELAMMRHLPELVRWMKKEKD